MSLAPRLDLRQSQSLVMTPQLQQAIKLLALSNVEVEAFLADELERNPLLEAESEFGEGEAAPRESGEQTDSAEQIANNESIENEALDIDISSSVSVSDSPSDMALGGSLSASGEATDFDRVAAPDISLRDHLTMQANTVLSGTDCRIALALIERIDETGYFSEDLLALAHRIGVPHERAEYVLGVIQGFDPGGVGARSLAECMTIQAKEADRYDPCMARLIANLHLLAHGDFTRLKRLCDVDDEDLRDMIAELRGYDPKPGCRFAYDDVQAVTPDIFVSRTADGWRVELNEANLPRLLVNRGYHADLVAGGGCDGKSKAWLGECLASANWLIKAMDQRQRTIVKVASEIVKQQGGFFRSGVTALRPLALRHVADAIDMHESTVSRVTSNKYLSCERGLYELKYFFTSGIQATDGGEAASAEAVKSHIGRLIDGEGEKILSDDALVTLLKAQGFDIARRTVAKYREAMGLGSSVQRRRRRKLGGV